MVYRISPELEESDILLRYHDCFRFLIGFDVCYYVLLITPITITWHYNMNIIYDITVVGY